MALSSNDGLDLSKENIQPLRQGKKAAYCKTALRAQVDPDIQQQLIKQREEFEYKIRMYEGDDPLELYYNYFIGLEQSFPKIERESNLILLLEDIIVKFKDRDKYKQDFKFIQLLIKYINVQSNPLEVYQLVYKEGLGTMCTIFYKAWAEELDKNNDFKRANQVFLLGINCRAQPLHELEEAHLQFQLRIARRMLEGNMDNTAQPSQYSRTAFSKLSSSKIISNRLSKNTAGIFQSISNMDKPRIRSFSTSKFKVYDEDEVDVSIKTDFKSKSDKLLKDSLADQENIMKANRWCCQNQKQKFAFKAARVSPAHQFQVQEDFNVACEQVKSLIRPRAVKNRREQLRCPVALFEPNDPTKKPMYPKQLVYVDGGDVQLEEIRAAKYWKKIRKMEEKKAAEEDLAMDIFEEPINLTKSCDISVEQKSNFIPQNEINNCVSGTSKFLSNAQSFIARRNSTMSLCTTNLPKHSAFIESVSLYPIERNDIGIKVKDTERMCSISKNNNYIESTNDLNSDFTNKVHVGSTENNGENANANVISKDVERFENVFKYHKFDDDLSDFRFCDKGNASTFHQSPSTSITINTRTAMNVIQKMWESPLIPKTKKLEKLANNCTEPVFKMPHSRKSEKFRMPLFDDEEMNFGNVFTSSTAFNIISDKESKKLGNVVRFPVYEDESINNGCTAQGSCGKSSNTKNDCSIVKSSKCAFLVYSEDEANNQSGKIDELLNIPFTEPKIISKCMLNKENEDEELVKPLNLLKMENEKNEPGTPLPFIVPVNLQDTPLEPENKENRPPKDYSTPSERRPLSGILTPAINVPVKEFESEGSGDEDDENYLIFNGRNDPDDDTCSTKAFAIALPSSTPFSRPEYSRVPRKSLLYNGSFSEPNFDFNGVKTSTSNQVLDNLKENQNRNTQNLSLILENSKEQGSASLGNSGNNMAFKQVS